MCMKPVPDWTKQTLLVCTDPCPHFCPSLWDLLMAQWGRLSWTKTQKRCKSFLPCRSLTAGKFSPASVLAWLHCVVSFPKEPKLAVSVTGWSLMVHPLICRENLCGGLWGRVVILPCRHHSGEVVEVEFHWGGEDVAGVQRWFHLPLGDPVALHLHAGPAWGFGDRLHGT